MIEKKLVVIMGSGCLPELGFISAPVLNPTKISTKIIASIIGRGQNKTYEVNPLNTDERIMLSSKNVYSENFGNAPVVVNIAQPTPDTSDFTMAPDVTVAAEVDTATDNAETPDATEVTADDATEPVETVAADVTDTTEVDTATDAVETPDATEATADDSEPAETAVTLPVNKGTATYNKKNHKK